MFCAPLLECYYLRIISTLFHIRNAQIKSFLYNGVARCPRCGSIHSKDNMLSEFSVFLCEDCFIDSLSLTEENFSNWYAFVALRVLCPSANI